MRNFYTTLHCLTDSAVGREMYRLDVKEDGELVTVGVEDSRRQDRFSYRREKDGHIIFDAFETGNVMRSLIITHDAFRFYLGHFLVTCDRKGVLSLCGGNSCQNLSVNAETTVAVKQGTALIANTFSLQNAQGFVINGTINAQSVIIRACGKLKGQCVNTLNRYVEKNLYCVYE